jgi:hypothetical protein
MKYLMIFSLFIVGCSTSATSTAEPEVQVISEDAPLPAGVKRKCWQEPKVKEVNQRPGIDTDGHWYHPSYTKIEEVKEGRWVDCDQKE